MTTDLKSLSINAWPFQEAVTLAERFKSVPPAKGYVLFETGYGPSGLPHIGTFGEVARTTMVRRAFEKISDIPTRLFAFSDDMDGLRKVPDNIPNKQAFEQYAALKPKSASDLDKVGGVRLTAIPDPFGTHESFGAHMNSRLKAFLDHYGFEYEFKSATECYQSGMFDATLIKALQHHQEICDLIKPTLNEARRTHYSPFLPIDPKTQRPLQVDVTVVDADKGIIRYQNPLEDDKWVETTVTGGNCKMQWKADWGMRWAALGVDYEMHGKDLLPTVELSDPICRIIGGKTPQTFMYELFLDDKGQKISKSKGNGLTIDEWLRYAPPETLSYYMYQSPRKAKRLYFDVIPRAIDDYQVYLEKFPHEEATQQLNNPVWHVHGGSPPKAEGLPGFNLLLNLAGVAHAEDPKVLWGYLARYMPQLSPQTHPFLDQLVKGAVNYYHDFVKPTKKYRLPTETEAKALSELADWLERAPATVTAEEIQTQIYEIGKKDFADNLKAWFAAMYETLLGQPQGPRMGSFVALYGKAETVQLIRKVLAGSMMEKRANG